MNRKIIVLVESTQSKVTLDSNAVTLGELKEELRYHNVSFNGEDVFKESRSKSILATDESILPTNIPWKGTVTNDLVFMVGAPHKRYNSGAMTRNEAYALVKKYGIQDLIKATTGRNFTQCATAVLIDFINKVQTKKAVKAPVSKPSKKETTVNPLQNLENLLKELVEKDIISNETADNIWNVANGKKALPIKKEETYAELAAEFDF